MKGNMENETNAGRTPLPILGVLIVAIVLLGVLSAYVISRPTKRESSQLQSSSEQLNAPRGVEEKSFDLQKMFERERIARVLRGPIQAAVDRQSESILQRWQNQFANALAPIYEFTTSPWVISISRWLFQEREWLRTRLPFF